MTDAQAPERIWAEPVFYADDTSMIGGDWSVDLMSGRRFEYVYGDLHTALQARLDEVEAERDDHRRNWTEAFNRNAALLERAEAAEAERDAVAAVRDMMGNLWADAKDRAEAAEARVKEMKKMVKAAYCEGFWAGKDGGWIVGPENQPWNASDVCKALAAMEKGKTDE
jgi:hypothetical protein